MTYHPRSRSKAKTRSSSTSLSQTTRAPSHVGQFFAAVAEQEQSVTFTELFFAQQEAK